MDSKTLDISKEAKEQAFKDAQRKNMNPEQYIETLIKENAKKHTKGVA